MQIEKIAKSLQ